MQPFNGREKNTEVHESERRVVKRNQTKQCYRVDEGRGPAGEVSEQVGVQKF